MENNQKDIPKQEPSNSDVPPLSNDRSQTKKEQENSTAKTNPSDTPKYEPQNIIVNVENANKDGWTIANIIALAAVLVSAALFYFTYRLFKEAQTQSMSATKAIISADSSLKLTKGYDSSSLAKQDTTFNYNYKLSKAVADSTDSNNKRLMDFYKESLKSANNFNKQSLDNSEKSLQIQIDAIDSAQKNFEKGNEPYLQMSKIVLDTFRVGKKLNISFQMENFGNYPAKIISDSCNYAICKSHPSPDDIMKSADKMFTNFERYLVKDSPIKMGISENDTLTTADYKMITEEGDSIFLVGTMRYKNLITENERLYFYTVKIKAIEGEAADYIKNDNIDAPKK